MIIVGLTFSDDAKKVGYLAVDGLKNYIVINDQEIELTQNRLALWMAFWMLMYPENVKPDILKLLFLK